MTSAEKGDIVLVVWSEEHSNYQIYHEGPSLHFLHTDSLSTLGLATKDSGKDSSKEPARDSSLARRKQVTAEVVDKEYCQAKKAENRFRVPCGAKFYRVRCRPYSSAAKRVAQPPSAAEN